MRQNLVPPKGLLRGDFGQGLMLEPKDVTRSACQVLQSLSGERQERRGEFMQRLHRVLAQEPGIESQNALNAVLAELPLRRADAYELLRRLIERGAVAKRRLGRHLHLFSSGSKHLDDWQEVAVMRNASLRLLVALIAKGGRMPVQQVEDAAAKRLGWRPGTTRYRLKCLLKANIIKEERAGNRFLTVELRRPLPPLQEESTPC